MNVYSLGFVDQFVKPIVDTGAAKVVQFSFPKGKVLEKHKSSSDILVFVLQGRIKFSAGEEAELSAGQMVSLDKHIEHALEALEESLVVLVLTPSPQAHTVLKP